jgi:hypothetical protein
MRRGRFAIILLILLLLSIGGVIIESRQSAADSKSIYKLESGSIAAIQIVSGDTGVGFEKKEGGWVMTEPAGYRIDPVLVEGLEKRLEQFDAVRIIEKKPKDLKKYGLDDPRTTVGIKLADGREKALFVGDAASSKYQYYVKDSGTDAVYTIPAMDVEAFGDGNPSTFRDRELLAVNGAEISLLSLDIGGKKEMRLQKDKDGKWAFVEPVTVSAKNDALEEIIKGIAALKIKDFVEDAPKDLARFGLDKPAVSLEIGDGRGNVRKIRFGETLDGKQEAYIASDREEGVFTVSIQDFDPYGIKIGDLLNEAPLSIGIDSVKTVLINDKGNVYEFRRDTAKPDEDSFTIGGRETKKDDFIALYVDLMALSSDGYDPAAPVERPEMEITFEALTGNKQIKLGLSRRDDKSYFMFINDEPLPFFVQAQKVELARRWLEKAAKD